MSEWLIPAITAALSAVFAALLAMRFVERRRLHQALWAAGLALFVVASAIEVLAITGGWSEGLYRVYFPVTAIMVGLLGAGTIALLSHRTATLAALGYVAVVGVLLLVFSAVDAVRVEALESAATAGEVPTGVFATTLTRVLHPLLDVPAAAFLLGGAVGSWRKTGGTYNLLIAAGALVFIVTHFLPSGGQTGLSVEQSAFVFHLGTLAGTVLLFAGYLRSREVRREDLSKTVAVPA
ncbi:MAG TPA: hypothetical protein VM681_01410 [Candidatus Thermoplasmatota archaeon]|nr:hypothetical protein [Candidatus Thermoplasmatota archaeon]